MVKPRTMMKTFAGAAVVLSAATALGACVSVTPVRGPDGEEAHLIKCPQTEACYERAAELCPGGYVVRSGGTTVSGSVSNGSGFTQSTSEVLVSCKSDLPVASAARAPIAKPEDALLCEAAYALVDGFAAYWVRISQGKLLDEKASKRDFTTVCRAMPENVQRCMHEKYRTAHAQACDAVLLRLEPVARSKVDSLFLQATGAKPSDAGVN
jgi:hypothetical protein